LLEVGVVLADDVVSGWGPPRLVDRVDERRRDADVVDDLRGAGAGRCLSTLLRPSRAALSAELSSLVERFLLPSAVEEEIVTR
jgi:hypothetical protein